MTDNAQIAAVVPEIIADVLDLEPAQLPARGRFYGDLQGESIELLEIGFRVEKLLGVRVDFGKLIDAEAGRPDAQGHVAPAALAQLKTRYPFLVIEALPPQPTVEDLKDLLTVDAITAFVQWSAMQSTRETGPGPVSHDPSRTTAPA